MVERKFYDTKYDSEYFGLSAQASHNNNWIFKETVRRGSDPNPSSPMLEDGAPTLREVLCKGPVPADYFTNEPKMDTSLQRAKQRSVFQASEEKHSRKNQGVYENLLNRKEKLSSLPIVSKESANAMIASEKTA